MKNYILKIIYRYKSLPYMLGYKNLDLMSLTKRIIDVSNQPIEYFTLSHNKIRIVNLEGNKCFFRECPLHDSKDSFFNRHFGRFIKIANIGCSTENFTQKSPIKTRYSIEEIKKIESLVLEAKQTPLFLRNIYDLTFFVKKDKFSLWNYQWKLSNSSLAKLGFNPPLDCSEELFGYFIQYIKSYIENYNMHGLLRIGQYECFEASKSLATFEFAKLLGIERLIAKAELVKLVDLDGECSFGVLISKAPGTRALDASVILNGSLQRELCILKVFDVLCWQVDHFANNYNVVVGKNNTDLSVCAFDNDAPQTFLPSVNVRFRSTRGCHELLDKKGYINLPHLDKEFANRLINLEYSTIIHALSPYLNKLQIGALCVRLSKIRKAITISSQARNNFLISETEWNDDTVREELNGRYGMTYCVQFSLREKLNQ